MRPHYLAEILDNALKFGGRKLDDGRVLGLRDHEVLLVEVHQLHFEVRNLLLVGRLEDESDDVTVVVSFDSDDVIVGGAS